MSRERTGLRPIGLSILVLATSLAITDPARAQFTCTTSGADQTCTNSGTSGNFALATTTGNATTTNTGTVNGSLATQTTAGGNAATTNSGHVTQSLTAFTNARGDATGTNSGNVGQFFLIETTAGGDGTGTNSGSVGQSFQVVTQGGGNATATNSGSSAQFFTVETVAGGNATGTNSGNVGQSFQVVTQGGGNAAGTNSGNVGQFFTIETVAGGNATGTNSGGVGQSFQVLTQGGNATATNSGSVGALFQVVAHGGGNATATNSGTVNGGALVGAVGGGTSSLTNSGTIGHAPGGPAIQFVGGSDALSLLASSTIIGNILLVGTKDTVNFLGGNQNLTFSGPGLTGATVGGTIPFVASGNRAAAIDPTPFALADRNLMDFTRGVSSILGSLGGTSAAPNGPVSSAFAPSASDSMAARVDDALAGLGIPALAYTGDNMVFKAPTQVTIDGRAVWGRAFGGEHVQDADGPLFRSATTFAGGAIGFDMVARPDLRLGAFVGGGETRQSLDQNMGHTDADTVFGGVYGRWGFVSFGNASFLDFALHGGGSSNSTARTINNNTLPGGIEIANASYNSWYVSPEVAYGVNLPLWSEYTLTPSVRLRYVAGLVDGYTESGTTAPLTVGSRTIQDFEERGEVTLTRAMPIGPDRLLASVHVGVLGLERVGDTTVNTVLLGASLPFVAPGKNTVGGVLGGGGLEWRTRSGVSFFGAAEAIGFSDSSTVYDARGGIRVAF